MKTPLGRDFYFPFAYGTSIDAEVISVVFCGVEYTGVGIMNPTEFQQVAYCWNMETTLKVAKKFGISFRKRLYSGETLENTKIFETKKLKKEKLDYVIENKIVVAIRNPFDRRYEEIMDCWRINTDGLKDIGFAKVFDPYTAFQEMSMFVGGVLPRDGNPMVELTGEKIMVQKHGMDKWSFRRPPKD